MTDTLELLTRRTANMESIGTIVRTMKTMAAINAVPYDEATRAIESWRQSVLDGIQAFLQIHGPLTQTPSQSIVPILIVLGSDHGLCGNYNEIVATEAMRQPHAREARILCVGARVEDALRAQGADPEPSLLPPANVDGLGRVADALVTRLEVLRQSTEPADIVARIVAIERGPEGRQSPVARQILPLDPALLRELSGRPRLSRTLPMATLPAPVLFAALVRNLLFATLYNAAAEALVTENAARLQRMQQAQQSVEKQLDDLRAEIRRVRQNEITTELLDVIVGFEALRKVPRPPTGSTRPCAPRRARQGD